MSPQTGDKRVTDAFLVRQSVHVRRMTNKMNANAPMRHDFDIIQLREILEGCPEYRADPPHHLDRPFMSAYQIAIRFAERHPDHRIVQELRVGGEGVGFYDSLAKRIAHFLSQAICRRAAGDIDGGFISHDNVEDFTFRYEGQRIRVSTLRTKAGHSIFRVRRGNADAPS